MPWWFNFDPYPSLLKPRSCFKPKINRVHKILTLSAQLLHFGPRSALPTREQQHWPRGSIASPGAGQWAVQGGVLVDLGQTGKLQRGPPPLFNPRLRDGTGMEKRKPRCEAGRGFPESQLQQLAVACLSDLSVCGWFPTPGR